jgi:hypothetical protein
MNQRPEKAARYPLASRKAKIMSNIFLLYKDVCDFSVERSRLEVVRGKSF